MTAGLYILEGDQLRHEPDALAWADWMENADRVIEVADGFTPTGRWQVQTIFLGLEMSEPEGEFFFATQLARGETLEALKVERVVLSEDMAKALANHAAMLNELRTPFQDVSD